MAIDPITALKWPRASSEDENSDKVKLQSKKKKNSPADVPAVVSDGDYDQTLDQKKMSILSL
jgi:hypothetical protein